MILLAACSGSSKPACPDAVDLRRQAHLDETDAPFLEAQCRDHDWPAAVITCVREATDEHMVDRCLAKLDDAAKKSLEQASRQLGDDKHASEFGELVAKVRRDVDAKVLTNPIFTRDHVCDGLRQTILETVAHIKECSDANELHLYGGYQQLGHVVSKIEKAPAETASEACRQAEAVVRSAFDC